MLGGGSGLSLWAITELEKAEPMREGEPMSSRKEEHTTAGVQGTGELMCGEPVDHGGLKVKKVELQCKVTNIIKPWTVM